MDGVQFVDHHSQLRDAQRSHQHGMLARLATLLEARFKFAARSVHDEQRDVRLVGTRYHVGDKVLVAGSIEQRHLSMKIKKI